MLFTSLRELKTLLEIDPDDTSEDVRLGFWIRYGCGLVEEWCDGTIRLLRSRTEYYNGTGTQRLVLRTVPAYVNPAPQVWVSQDGRAGQNPESTGAFPDTDKLTFGTDFFLDVRDGDANVSRTGILVRVGAFWNKAVRRQAGLLYPYVDDSYKSIKVTYTAGHISDDLPAEVVLAATQTIARLRFMMPLGLPVTGDSWEGRNVNVKSDDKNWLFGQVKHLLQNHRRRRF